MADLSIDELLAEQSKEAILESLLTMAEGVGLPARSWNPRGVTRTLFLATATVLALMAIPIRSMIKGGFLDHAEKLWLSFLAIFVYGVTRREATFATGSVVVDNLGGGVYAFDALEAVFLNEAEGKTYRNTTAFTVDGLETGIVVPVIATEVGTASNAAAGQINNFETPVAGLVVTNPQAVLGTDAETDEELRQVCRERIAALSPNGARDAYAYVAKRTKRPDGSIVPINRVFVASSSSNAEVKMWIATASGAPEEADRLLVEKAIFETVVPNGITPFCLGAIEVTVPVAYTAHVIASAGMSEDEIATEVSRALNALFSFYPINGNKKELTAGHLWTELVRATIAKSAPPIFDVSLTGFSDVSLHDGRVAVLGSLTPTVILEEST